MLQNSRLSVIDHPQSDIWHIISVAYVCCLSVCMSLCSTITFESFDIGSLFSDIRCISRGYGVKFVNEGHRVKVKVTGAKRSKIRIPAM